MKKTILFAAFALITSMCFCQAKPDSAKQKPSVEAKKDTAAPAAQGTGQTAVAPIVRKTYFIILDEGEMTYLHAMIRTSGKLVGSALEDYIEFIDSRKHEVPIPEAPKTK